MDDIIEFFLELILSVGEDTLETSGSSKKRTVMFTVLMVIYVALLAGCICGAFFGIDIILSIGLAALVLILAVRTCWKYYRNRKS